MKETLKAFCLLDKNHLLHNAEKAAKVLGIWEVVSTHSIDALWEIANADAEPVPEGVFVGSRPVLEIPTEKNPDFVRDAPPPSPVRRKRP